MMSISEEKHIIETISKEYLEPDAGRIIDQKILSMVTDHILPWIKGPEVLEMGFGDDVWTRKIIERFGHSSIVDASQILLNEGKGEYGDKIEIYNVLFEEFMPDRKYDTVIASYGLEHVKDPVNVLTKASTWINEEGHVIITVPHADSFNRRVAVCMGIQKITDEIGKTDRQTGHRRVYTIEKMERDITLSGLAVIRKKGLYLKFLPQSMMIGFSDELLRGYMKLSESVPMEDCAMIAFDCVLKKITKK